MVWVIENDGVHAECYPAGESAFDPSATAQFGDGGLLAWVLGGTVL